MRGKELISLRITQDGEQDRLALTLNRGLQDLRSGLFELLDLPEHVLILKREARGIARAIMTAVQGEDGVFVAEFGPKIADKDLREAHSIAIEGHRAAHIGREEHEFHFFRLHDARMLREGLAVRKRGVVCAHMNLQRTVREPSPLLPFLFSAFSEAKKTRVRQWLKYGGVQVNGRVVTRHDHELKAGDEIAIQPPKAPPREQRAPLPSGLRLLHEDDHILVIEKGAGWLTIAKDNGKGRNAYAVLMDHVRSADPRLRVWIVHRLDRETSGLLVFAKTEEAKHTLQENWQDFEKRYLAIVEGSPPEEEGTLRSHLDESNPLHVRSAPAAEDTREAVTHYRVLKKGRGRALLELTLETGRRHQIRVQLADARCPVVGDDRYGSITQAFGVKRLALHATRLTFDHPETGEEMTFESPLPPELEKMSP